MPKTQEKRGDYVISIPVLDSEDASTLDSEHVWDILHFVRERPMGVRPKEVANKFDIGINQAYEKLRKLEKAKFLAKQKQRSRPGRPGEASDGAERKTLLYVASPMSEPVLDFDWDRVLQKKYGRYVMEKVRPVLLEFYRQVIEEMKKDENLKQWYPAPHVNICPDCGMSHQALELFRSLGSFAVDVTGNWSYEMDRILLDNGYITRKEFDESVEKEEDDEEWAYLDAPAEKKPPSKK